MAIPESERPQARPSLTLQDKEATAGARFAATRLPRAAALTSFRRRSPRQTSIVTLVLSRVHRKSPGCALDRLADSAISTESGLRSTRGPSSLGATPEQELVSTSMH